MSAQTPDGVIAKDVTSDHDRDPPNGTDREGTDRTFRRGMDGFSEDDLDMVMDDAETAKKKSPHYGKRLETRRLPDISNTSISKGIGKWAN